MKLFRLWKVTHHICARGKLVVVSRTYSKKRVDFELKRHVTHKRVGLIQWLRGEW